jgi:hypothetical protein
VKRTETNNKIYDKEVVFMKNIRILLYSLAFIIITAACFQSIAMAAQVTRINTNKGFIFINGSIADGFVMGAEVCFYPSSDSDEEITCGRVKQASESFARVKVDNRIANRIRYGMEARLSDEEITQEALPCSNDSDCGGTGFCFNGKCRDKQEKVIEYKACSDDSDCGDAGFCFNGKCRQR